MTSIRSDGNCRICGAYSQSQSFESNGICMPCDDKLKNWSKEDLVKALSKAKKEVWNLKYIKDYNENNPW